MKSITLRLGIHHQVGLRIHLDNVSELKGRLTCMFLSPSDLILRVRWRWNIPTMVMISWSVPTWTSPYRIRTPLPPEILISCFLIACDNNDCDDKDNHNHDDDEEENEARKIRCSNGQMHFSENRRQTDPGSVGDNTLGCRTKVEGGWVTSSVRHSCGVSDRDGAYIE